MANQPVMRGIKDSWSLIAFARAHGKMQVAPFENKQTGDEFKSCVFTSPSGNVCFVAFSSNLGELTPQEIARQKDELQVVELEEDENGVSHYSLCKRGNNAWEDVDLGL